MRKITSILMLLTMCVGASWAQTTETIEVSTNVASPEHVYYMRNGNGRWMTQTTGPTVNLANIAQFAFFEGTRTGEGSETPYKIYCVTAQKWLSYTKAGSYANQTGFVTLVESQDVAESWVATIQDGNGSIGNVYQFAPYNNSGVASKYMNWFQGSSSNPNDNTNISVGLYENNATSDNGSCWILTSSRPVAVTYTFKYNGVEKTTQTTNAFVGEAYPDVNLSLLPLGLVASKPAGVIVDEGNDGAVSAEIDITQGTLPFVPAANSASIEHWYYMNIRDDNSRTYLKYESGVDYIKAADNKATVEAAEGDNYDAYLWAFIGSDPYDGYKIVNKASGVTYILSAPVAPTGSKDANQLARMVEETGAAGNTKWMMKRPTYSNASAGAFYVEHPTATSFAFNRQDYNSVNTLCYWDGRDVGSGICVEEVGIEIFQAEYAAWMAQCVGDKLGQYYVPAENEAAYNTAKSALDAATTIAEAHEAVSNCKNQYVFRGLTVGNYYRVKNTAQGSFLGIDGYTLNMKHQAEDDANPSLIWKYEQDGENYYLKNVYAGLYPQEIPGGQDKTAKIGTGKDKKFTYVEHAYPTDTEDAKWNIFFGGTQVNCEGSANNVGNVNYWYGDNAHYYIYEVEKTDAELETLCVNYYKENAYTFPKTIETNPEAIVISPGEFAAPSVVNAAIEALYFTAEGATTEKIQALYAALTNSNNEMVKMQNAISQHGDLLSCEYNTSDAEFGTIILPINWAIPTGWTVSTCAAAPNGILTLVPRDGNSKNNPYIVQLSEEARNKKYQFIGYSNGAATTNQTQGLLTGVLESGGTVPAGSYILANHNGKIGFYRVAENADFTAAVNKCYLTLPADGAARFEALFFDGTTTAIEGIQDTQAKQNSGIYNMAGQRLGKLQKGLNIVNGKVVLVK